MLALPARPVWAAPAEGGPECGEVTVLDSGVREPGPGGWKGSSAGGVGPHLEEWGPVRCELHMGCSPRGRWPPSLEPHRGSLEAPGSPRGKGTLWGSAGVPGAQDLGKAALRRISCSRGQDEEEPGGWSSIWTGFECSSLRCGPVVVQ